ncbi:hypothetical protein [Arthrobacter sp. USHLN218]|uniref:hypothetical protein n=1 Tax=Arthrobacter sp. USHLN218 TaxID=3081232 RepID=UPI0030188A9B
MEGEAAGYLFLVLGAVSIIAAIIGGGVKLPGGIDVPKMHSKLLRGLLAFSGIAFLFIGLGIVALQLNQTVSPDTSTTPQTYTQPAVDPEPYTPQTPAATTPPDPSVEWTSYIAALDSACSGWVPQLDSTLYNLNAYPQYLQQGLYDAAAVVSSGRERMLQVPPPSSGNSAQELFSAMERINSLLSAMAQQAGVNNESYNEYLRQYYEARNSFNASAVSYGLTICAVH